jgi:hypothetical protein
MLRCLMAQAQPVMTDFFWQMLEGADYLLLPKQARRLTALNDPFLFSVFPVFAPLWLSRPSSMFACLLHVLPK